MLLRSSSTPVLGSLLASFSESPVNNSIHYHDTNSLFKHHPIHHQTHNRSPYYQTGCRTLSTAPSCSSSPISPSVAEFSELSHQGFRRVQSDGNLEGLAYASCNSNDNKGDQHHSSTQRRKFSGRPKHLVLETIPSFSFSNARGCYEDDEEEEEDSDYEWGETSEENVTKQSGQFDLSNTTGYQVLNEEVRAQGRIWNSGFVEEREMMYLARGLGIDGATNGYGGGGGGGGRGENGDFYSAGGDSGDDGSGTEAHYKKMVQENPGNPLFLRNYAQFLYQTKRDLKGAEEYYSRAILVDPKDGEILSQYAKLVWELYKEQDRATAYFERAVQASPDDCHIHAAYASFLWETEEEEDECGIPREFDTLPPHLHEGALASAGI